MDFAERDKSLLFALLEILNSFTTERSGCGKQAAEDQITKVHCKTKMYSKNR
jgi:hypothetical protein